MSTIKDVQECLLANESADPHQQLAQVRRVAFAEKQKPEKPKTVEKKSMFSKKDD